MPARGPTLGLPSCHRSSCTAAVHQQQGSQTCSLGTPTPVLLLLLLRGPDWLCRPLCPAGCAPTPVVHCGSVQGSTWRYSGGGGVKEAVQSTGQSGVKLTAL